jgi:hypothetical protein
MKAWEGVLLVAVWVIAGVLWIVGKLRDESAARKAAARAATLGWRTATPLMLGAAMMDDHVREALDRDEEERRKIEADK